MLTYLMKNNYVFQRKNIMQKVVFLIFCLIKEIGCILVFAFEFNLLSYDLSIKIYEQNPVSQRDVI